MDLKTKKVGFLGAGNMARAIGIGLIEKGVLDPKNIWASARTEATLQTWKNLGTSTTLSNLDIVENCDVIFLAVKPHILDEALQFSKPENCKDKKISSKRRLFVSVVVGVTLRALRNKLKAFDDFGVIRTMPNTPLTVASGITVYCGDNFVKDEELAAVHELFSHIGIVEKVPESQITATGILSGCGPAFAYQIIEALADGAVMVGVPRAMATKFAAQVLVGSGKMVLETGKHPGQLKDEVCSPGGVTIAGVYEMEDGGVRAAMMNAIKAAVERSEEMVEMMQNQS